MKYVRLFFAFIVSITALAQRPLPVTTNSATPYDVKAILAREGEQVELTVNAVAVWNKQEINGGHYMGGASIAPGKALYVSNVTVGTDAKSVLQISMGQLQNFGNPPQVAKPIFFPQGGGTISIPYNDYWLMPGSNAGGLAVLKVFDADTLKSHRWIYSISGTQITADLNFSAAKKMLWIGTSIPAGTGTTDTQNMYVFRLRKYLRDTLNYDVRLINMSVSGSNSVQTETYRQRGRYNIGKVNSIFWDHGANDAGNAIPVATTIANLDKMVKDKQRYNPDAYFFIVSPSVNGNSTTEAAQVSLRTAYQTYVTGLGDPKVKYIAGTGTAWTTAQSGTFTTDGIHPNDSGNARIYWALRNYIISNNLTLP